MKTIKGVLLIMLGLILFGGCGEAAGETTANETPANETITNRKIPVEDVTEFYYTVENINYNAFYQRYRFYREDGKNLFYHETRKRPDDYGPTTEEDITSSGTVELSDAEWKDFLTYLKDGTVSARKDTEETGDSGPWTFLYWENDKGKYQVFEFSSYNEQAGFEEFCSALAAK